MGAEQEARQEELIINRGFVDGRKAAPGGWGGQDRADENDLIVPRETPQPFVGPSRRSDK